MSEPIMASHDRDLSGHRRSRYRVDAKGGSGEDPFSQLPSLGARSGWNRKPVQRRVEYASRVPPESARGWAAIDVELQHGSVIGERQVRPRIGRDRA